MHLLNLYKYDEYILTNKQTEGLFFIEADLSKILHSKYDNTTKRDSIVSINQGNAYVSSRPLLISKWMA